MTIALGADDAAFELKEIIKKYLEERGIEVTDYGVFDTGPSLYPDIAVKVAEAIAEGKHTRGILMCGTGLGMAITANKVPGIRAATCHDTYSARAGAQEQRRADPHDGRTRHRARAGKDRRGRLAQARSSRAAARRRRSSGSPNTKRGS